MQPEHPIVYVRERIDSGHESTVEIVASTLAGAQAGHDGWEEVDGFAQQNGGRRGWGTYAAEVDYADWLLVTEHRLAP
jgi:hypothetical protein